MSFKLYTGHSVSLSGANDVAVKARPLDLITTNLEQNVDVDWNKAALERKSVVHARPSKTRTGLHTADTHCLPCYSYERLRVKPV